MRPLAVVSLAFALVLTAALAAMPRLLRAQEGTPADRAAEIEIEGVTIEYLSHVEPARAPEHLLELVRVTIQPGFGIEVFEHHGAATIYVASGTMRFIPGPNGAEVQVLYHEPGAQFAASQERLTEECRAADGCSLGPGFSVVQSDTTEHGVAAPQEAASVVNFHQTEETSLYVSGLTPDGVRVFPMGCDRGC